MRAEDSEEAPERDACGVEREQPMRHLAGWIERRGLTVECLDEAAGLSTPDVLRDSGQEPHAEFVVVRAELGPVRVGAQLVELGGEFHVMTRRVAENDPAYDAGPDRAEVVPAKGRVQAVEFLTDHLDESVPMTMYRTVSLERLLVQLTSRGPERFVGDQDRVRLEVCQRADFLTGRGGERVRCLRQQPVDVVRGQDDPDGAAENPEQHRPVAILASQSPDTPQSPVVGVELLRQRAETGSAQDRSLGDNRYEDVPENPAGVRCGGKRQQSRHESLVSDRPALKRRRCVQGLESAAVTRRSTGGELGTCPGMSENECLIEASVEDVFAILTDGWSYAAWVVGASRIRDVDPPWPEPGGRIHHSVGAWPLLLDDTTTSLEYEPLRRLRLQVRAWPAGHGEVEFRAQEESGGCRLVMTEKPVSGPVALLPSAVADAMLHPRNAEALRRLKLLAEKRA